MTCDTCLARVQGSGITVQGSGFRVQGSGFKVKGSGFRVSLPGRVRVCRRGSAPARGGPGREDFRDGRPLPQHHGPACGLGFGVEGFGFRAQGCGLREEGSGFRI